VPEPPIQLSLALRFLRITQYQEHPALLLLLHECLHGVACVRA